MQANDDDERDMIFSDPCTCERRVFPEREEDTHWTLTHQPPLIERQGRRVRETFADEDESRHESMREKKKV